MVYHKALPISSVICHEIISGKITATISDHLPQISLAPNILLSSSAQKSNFYERDWLKLQKKTLCFTILINIGLTCIKLINTIFLWILFKQCKLHLGYICSIKKVIKNKVKYKAKPWVTPALQKSISIKNNFLKKKS